MTPNAGLLSFSDFPNDGQTENDGVVASRESNLPNSPIRTAVGALVAQIHRPALRFFSVQTQDDEVPNFASEAYFVSDYQPTWERASAELMRLRHLDDPDLRGTSAAAHSTSSRLLASLKGAGLPPPNEALPDGLGGVFLRFAMREDLEVAIEVEPDGSFNFIVEHLGNEVLAMDDLPPHFARLP